MRLPFKMHRPTAVIAAVLIILNQALNTAAAISVSSTFTTFISKFSLASNTLIAIMLAVILFRGKKDTVAGTVFAITAVVPLFVVGYDFLSLLKGYDGIGYVLANILLGLAVAAFRGLAAVECLGKRKISAGGGQALLWVLPILCFCFALWKQILLCIYDGMNPDETIANCLIVASGQWLGPVLMGVSLSVPNEKNDK